MKLLARERVLFTATLSVCAILLACPPATAIEFCRMPNGGWGRGTVSGIGPGSAGVGTPPFGGTGWTEAGGWGIGDVIEVSSNVTPISPPLDPSGGETIAQEGSRTPAGDGIQGIINLIPAIIGIVGAGRGGGTVSPGSGVAPRGPSRSAPTPSCHTGPDGRLHCGSN